MIRPKISEHDVDGAFEIRLQGDILLKLMTIARSLGVAIDEALQQLIDAGASHLEPGDVQLHLLSPKQTEVLKYLRAGLSVKEIANQLGVKEETVRTHIHRVRSVLGCSDLLSLRFNGMNGTGSPQAFGPEASAFLNIDPH